LTSLETKSFSKRICPVEGGYFTTVPVIADNIPSNESMNWKGFGRKQWRANWDIIQEFAWRGLRKTMKNVSQDSRRPSRDSNRAPLVYSVSPRRPCSVTPLNSFVIPILKENVMQSMVKVKKIGKFIPETARGGPLSCETSRLPHFLHNRLTDVGEVVSLTRRPPFIPRKIPGTHFCYRLSRPQDHSAAGGIR
jgi:hypothetical protein